MSDISVPTLTKVAAVGLVGIQAGALCFGSFASARTFLILITDPKDPKKPNKEGVELVKKFFPTWWPCGRDFMAPLALLTSLAGFAAYHKSNGSGISEVVTKRDPTWLIIAGSSLFMLPYTALVMGSDINNLREGSTADAAKTINSFCNKHHVRTAIASSAFVLGLVTLVSNKRLFR
jgi:hypothetical protein